MTIPAPEVGKTYVSRNFKKWVFHVEDFTPAGIDPANGEAYGFLVECCAPGDEGDVLAWCYSFTEDEWATYDFVELT